VSSRTSWDGPAPPGRSLILLAKRIVLAAVTAVLAVNLYTGAPLLAIWVGSRVQGGVGLTMTTVVVVMGTLIGTVVVLVMGLHYAEAAYRRVTGQIAPRRTAPWMRSMRDEREEYSRKRRPLNDFEKVMVVAVVLAAAAFEAWFFFLSGSPIGHA
jgi:hypothetical protein